MALSVTNRCGLVFCFWFLVFFLFGLVKSMFST